MREPGATKAKALLAAISLLLLGAVAGVVIDRHLVRESTPTHGSAAAFHDAALASLEDRLDLDATQRRAVDSIIGLHHETLRRTWTTIHARLGATVDSVHRDLETVLDPEQRAELRAWLGEMPGPDH